MKRKLNCIMLIDDNADDNFFHQRAIKRANAADLVITMQLADEALDYLKSHPSEKDSPDLIFLDINMPGMNGWEFIEEYKNITNNKSGSIIIMLTTSQNPDDIVRAQTEKIIRGFKTKPLTPAMLEEIIDNFF